MNKFIILFSTIGLLCSCNHQANKSEKDKSLQDSLNLSAPAANNGIDITFPENSDSIEISGFMNGLSDSKTYILEAKEGEKLTASIHPETSPANIRFNQIISPSNAQDGPFGTDLSHDLNESGQWKLIVGGSNMQGDDYIGNYTLKIILK